MGGANIHGDLVVLRAARGDYRVSLRTRSRIADRKRAQLEATGWTVEVLDLDEEDPGTMIPYVPPRVDKPDS